MSKQAPLPAPEPPAGVAPVGMPLWKNPPTNFDEVFGTTVTNEAKGTTTRKVATMRISGPIYAGWMGVSATAVAEALHEIGDDVEEIRVRINTPGGDVFQAMEILNMLRAHPARTVAIVDGIAASSGSFLAAGLDETVMSPGTQMMVHDAAGLCMGRADDMRKVAQALDTSSNSIASVYAQVAGGTTEEWRAIMKSEMWYTADEAVEAKLADRVELVKDAGKVEQAEAEDPDAEFEDMVRNRYDLSIFNYAGRDTAPAPKPPAAAVGSINTSERGPAVAFTNEQLATMRQKLGLAGDADEATIVAAMTEALDEAADPTPAPEPPPAPELMPPTPPSGPKAVAAGTMVIDKSAWDETQKTIKRLEANDQKRRTEERDTVLAQAVTDGKFLASSKPHYARLWDTDPEGARAVIDSLTPGVIPTNELGHAGGETDLDDELAHLYGPQGVN